MGAGGRGGVARAGSPHGVGRGVVDGGAPPCHPHLCAPPVRRCFWGPSTSLRFSVGSLGPAGGVPCLNCWRLSSSCLTAVHGSRVPHSSRSGVSRDAHRAPQLLLIPLSVGGRRCPSTVYPPLLLPREERALQAQHLAVPCPEPLAPGPACRSDLADLLSQMVKAVWFLLF